MFHTLRELCSDSDIRIEDFEANFTKLGKAEHKVVEKLCKRVMWKRNNLKSLHSRISRILAKRDVFTVREMKFLKRCVGIQLKQGRVDF